MKTSEHAVIHPGETPEIADTKPDDEIQGFDLEPFAMRTTHIQATV